MAVLDAILADSPIWGHAKLTYWGENLEGFDGTYLDYAAHDTERHKVGSIVRVFTSQQPSALAGLEAASFGDDYYNRIHVAPSTLNIGNLLSEQVREFTVWNAYLAPKTLQSVTGQDVDGITLTQPVTPPATYQPLKEFVYEVSVALIGPPTIDGRYFIQFTGEELGTLRIIGQRVVIFPFAPHLEISERLQWLTDIIKTRQGEQRIAMRHAPRQEFGHRYTLDEHQFARLKTIADAWVFRSWALPVWREATHNINVSGGANEILFNTAYADYRAGGLAILFKDDVAFEAVEIDQVLADRLTLIRPTLNSYSDATICPARFARTKDGIDIMRMGAGLQEISATFSVEDNINLAHTDYAQYKGFDIVADKNYRLTRSINERIRRPIVEIDNGQGVVVIDTEQDYTDFAQTLETMAEDSQQLWRLRRWLHSRYGKQKAFWLPSYNRDLIPTEPITELATNLTVKNTDLPLYGEFPLAAQIVFKTGETIYRDITGATGTNVVLSAAIGARAVDDFDMISIMSLTRLNADAINLNHQSGITRMSVPAMRVPA